MIARLAPVLLTLSLAGCANGIAVSDEETISCRDSGCTVWTESELRALANRAMTEGYRRGWRDANKQAGRDL